LGKEIKAAEKLAIISNPIIKNPFNLNSFSFISIISIYAKYNLNTV